MSLWLTTTSFSDLLVRFYKGNTTTSDTAGASVVSTQCGRAEAVVMSALASRYSMPFSPVPPEAIRIAQDIASYFIIRSSTYQDGKEKNRMLAEFKEAFDDLKAISKGEVGLTYTDGSIVSVMSSNRFRSNTINYTAIFEKDDPRAWELDPVFLDDIKAARA